MRSLSLALLLAWCSIASGEDRLARHFEVPKAYAGQMGSYRSPLVFDDGRMVRTAGEWKERRREILKYWSEVLGPWPELIERPEVVVLREERRENFAQQRVRVTIAPGQTTEGWLLIPDGAGKRPAVLVPFYEPETSIGLKEPLRDFAYQLTRRGFVTLSIGSPGGDARKPELGKAVCQPLHYLAYVAANCCNALANHPRVDAERIGVVGHSYGGKWSMFAAAFYDKFAACVTSDPGIVFDESRPNVNYWEPWYLGLDPTVERKRGVITPESPRTGAYKRLVAERRDLHEVHALLAPRPFLVSGGSEDPAERWVALNHAIEVYGLLGAKGRVGMTNRPTHAPTVESNEVIYAFFEKYLK